MRQTHAAIPTDARALERAIGRAALTLQRTTKIAALVRRAALSEGKRRRQAATR